MNQFEEERLAGLIGALPPAPGAWVEAAKQLPLARREMDEIVTRAQADLDFRAAVIADLEQALQAAGYDVDESLMPELRARLTASQGN